MSEACATGDKTGPVQVGGRKNLDREGRGMCERHESAAVLRGFRVFRTYRGYRVPNTFAPTWNAPWQDELPVLPMTSVV